MIEFFLTHGWRKPMTKEYEIGLNLLRKVNQELEKLLNVEDRLTARRIVNSIINPITASTYQIRVGDGPRREEFLEVLLKLLKEVRDLSDIEAMKESVEKLLQLLKEVEAASVEKKES
ncbi:MAG: hypothetical protein RMH93_04240 [Aquificaceae bacterium]|nr:hypothetical protein [Aquificaceae bacterium]